MHYIIFLSYFELGNILFPTIEFGCILPIIITLVNVLLFYIVLSKISPSNIPLRYIELFNNGQYCIRLFCTGYIVSHNIVMGNIVLFGIALGIIV